MNEEINVEATHRTSMVMWAALLVSQVLFCVLVIVNKPEPFEFEFAQPFLGENSALVTVLSVLALSNLAISFALRESIVICRSRSRMWVSSRPR